MSGTREARGMVKRFSIPVRVVVTLRDTHKADVDLVHKLGKALVHVNAVLAADAEKGGKGMVSSCSIPNPKGWAAGYEVVE